MVPMTDPSDSKSTLAIVLPGVVARAVMVMDCPRAKRLPADGDDRVTVGLGRRRVIGTFADVATVPAPPLWLPAEPVLSDPMRLVSSV